MSVQMALGLQECICLVWYRSLSAEDKAAFQELFELFEDGKSDLVCHGLVDNLTPSEIVASARAKH